MSEQPSPPQSSSPPDPPPVHTAPSSSQPNPSSTTMPLPDTTTPKTESHALSPAPIQPDAPAGPVDSNSATPNVQLSVGNAHGDATSCAKHSSPLQTHGEEPPPADRAPPESKVSGSEEANKEVIEGEKVGEARDGKLQEAGEGNDNAKQETAQLPLVEKSERDNDKSQEKGERQTQASTTEKDEDAKKHQEEVVKEQTAESGVEGKETEEDKKKGDKSGDHVRNVKVEGDEGEMQRDEKGIKGESDEKHNESIEEEPQEEHTATSEPVPSSAGKNIAEGKQEGTGIQEAEDNVERDDEMQVDSPQDNDSSKANENPGQQTQSAEQTESRIDEQQVHERMDEDNGTKHVTANACASGDHISGTPAPSSPEAGRNSKPDVIMTVAEEVSPGTAADGSAPQEKDSEEDGVAEIEAVPDNEDATNDSAGDTPKSSTPKRPRRASQRNLRSQMQKYDIERMEIDGGEAENKVEDEVKGQENEHEDSKQEKERDGDGKDEASVHGATGRVKHKGTEEAIRKIDQMLEELPRPEMTEDGMRMKVGEALFVTYEQLEEVKKKRMRDKRLTPIENLTFADVASFNRDHLRCYCFIYGTPRRKKSEMEIDMAMFVCLWHRGKEGYVLPDYIPKNSKDRIGETAAAAAYEAGIAMTKEPPSLSVTPEKSDGDNVEIARSSRRSSVISRSELSRDSHEGLKTPSRNSGRTASKTPARTSGKAPASGYTPTSAKRPPPHPQNVQNLHSSPIRQATQQNQVGTERAVNRGSVPGSNLQTTELHKQVHINKPGPSSAARGQAAGTARTSRSGIPVQPMPQGFGTSFKQKVHARAAGEKFKAAYNGAGPSIVNVVENAAAYFTGKDSPELIQDQAKSYARYQFNVDLLSEIFDGPPAEENSNKTDTDRQDVSHQRPEGVLKANAMREVAKRMRSSSSTVDGEAELELWEEEFKQLESDTKEMERANMRFFQRLERAETEEEIESVKRDFEQYHNVRISGAPPPLVRRKLDKSLAPVLMPDNQCRILRFKVG